VRFGGRENVGQVRIDDDVLGFDYIDTVRQRRTGQVGIEQRGDSAGTGYAEPDSEIFRPVRHHQRNDIALADTLRDGPARILVCPVVVLAECQGTRVGEQCDPLRMGLGQPFGNVGVDSAGVSCDRRNLAQDRQGALQIREFAVDPADQSHRFPLVRRPPASSVRYH
jgi:hypothetical protein